MSYDPFGDGKTAVKASLSKYVQGQALGGDLPDRPLRLSAESGIPAGQHRQPFLGRRQPQLRSRL
jgi:hypothetical protein